MDKLIILLIGLGFSIPVFSAINPDELDPSLELSTELCHVNEEEKGLDVYFGNGMRTRPFDALVNSRQLRDAVLNERGNRNSNLFSFKLAYNIRENIFLEVIEVARQFNFNFFREIINGRYDPENIIHQGFLTASLVTGWMDPFVLVDDEDSIKHANLYRNSIANDKDVLLVSHSQGNFYANAAYEKLSILDRDRFYNIAVATPAHTTPNGTFPWISMDGDFICWVPNSLSCYVSNNEPESQGHLFSKYLSGKNTRNLFNQHVRDVIFATIPDGSGNEGNNRCIDIYDISVLQESATGSLSETTLLEVCGSRHSSSGVIETPIDGVIPDASSGEVYTTFVTDDRYGGEVAAYTLNELLAVPKLENVCYLNGNYLGKSINKSGVGDFITSTHRFSVSADGTLNFALNASQNYQDSGASYNHTASLSFTGNASGLGEPYPYNLNALYDSQLISSAGCGSPPVPTAGAYKSINKDEIHVTGELRVSGNFLGSITLEDGQELPSFCSE